ncbi:MAG: B12-binding domain-containing protein, partial [Syntrophorhabdales bacterium]
MAGELVKLLSDLEEEKALQFVDQALDKGVDAADLLAETKEAMSLVGQRFASCEYFIPDLIFSGEILKQIIQKLEPHLRKTQGAAKLGKVVVGT